MKNLKIKRAKFEDREFIFNLYNFGIENKFFKNRKKIDFKSHLKWFKSTLKSQKIYIHICKFHTEPIGYIKYNIFRKNCAYISIIIYQNKKYRGLSYVYLKKSISTLFKKLKIKYYYAEVLKSNTVSQKFFLKNKFYAIKINKKLSKFFNYKNFLYYYEHKK